MLKRPTIVHNRFLLLPTATGVDTYQHPSGWKPSVRDRQTAFLLVPEGVQPLHLLNLSQGLGSFGRTPLVDFRRFLSFTCDKVYTFHVLFLGSWWPHTPSQKRQVHWCCPWASARSIGILNCQDGWLVCTWSFCHTCKVTIFSWSQTPWLQHLTSTDREALAPLAFANWHMYRGWERLHTSYPWSYKRKPLLLSQE